MTARRPSLAVAGATGAIGGVMLQIISQHADVWGEVRLIGPPADAAHSPLTSVTICAPAGRAMPAA